MIKKKLKKDNKERKLIEVIYYTDRQYIFKEFTSEFT